MPRFGAIALILSAACSTLVSPDAWAQAPDADVVNYTTLAVPAVDAHTLNILSPTTLELIRITTKPAAGSVSAWDFVNDDIPTAAQFVVEANGVPIPIRQVGFKRRPLSAPPAAYDLRIGNSLILELGASLVEDAHIVVTNPNGSVFPSHFDFSGWAHALRYGPAVHVNQEGYVPSWPKKASVGYWIGTLGELKPPALSFQVVDATTGVAVHSGALSARPDSGWPTVPAPYQQVYEADFSSFTRQGEYMLVVPGLGASLPFVIDEGIAMNFARTYAQGLFHQRCGHPNHLPFTRHTHEACHLAPASVPSGSGFTFTWNKIAANANTINSNNPPQIAPKLTSEAAALFPYVRKGTVDVSGGHHDAGDYSKYTTNSAMLVHLLTFAADSFSGVGALDNLGLPESGDGIGDMLQEAKIEADFLLKMQDTDGGFYFLVYPRDRAYEHDVLPDDGDPQVVWPKTTSATAAAVGALAELGSSQRFKAAYPTEASAYLDAARRGWTFLTQAISQYGKAGAYQKITHYGDDFTHDDELAWAASAMFVATRDRNIHDTLLSWFDPSDPATRRWGWWRMYSGYGAAIRIYAFADRTGRVPTRRLDRTHLAQCKAEIRAAADDAVTWAGQSAYGTSFPAASKSVMSAGWYFSGAQTYDIATGYQLDARSQYLDAMLRNFNYEGGSNALNLTYLTGIGWKRQREIVHQYAWNDPRVLPPNGFPIGSLQTGPVPTSLYGTQLSELTFPRDNAPVPTPFYDRWTDTNNILTEFVHTDQARALGAATMLGALTRRRSQTYRAMTGASIQGIPVSISTGNAFTVSLDVPGFDLGDARIIWEASGQQPAYGQSYTYTPQGTGLQWIEAEAHWPDGRRAVARQTLFAEIGLPVVSVMATDNIAKLFSTTDTMTFTFTRTGSSTNDLAIDFGLSGTAAKWFDYWRPSHGDMPQTLVMPAGANTISMILAARDNVNDADPQTLIVTMRTSPNYIIGSPNFATATIVP
ncbi:MAG: glycoside hydrolase family 9 protein [Polyangiaceae bacterium]|nr:glycoside hydrolase family 9 protein [Polyangiaceae bacterium]